MQSSYRKMALLIGETIAKSNAFAKSDEVMEAISGYVTTQSRASFGANAGGFASMYSSLAGSGLAGMDPANAANILGRINASLSAGGAHGEASQFFTGSVGRSIGLDALQTQLFREAGAFATPDSVFGKGSMYERSTGQTKSFTDGDRTFLDSTRDMINRQYGGNSEQAMLLRAQATGNHMGISMSQDTARAIGEAASSADVSLSVHAPYYINLANPDAALAEKSKGYILDSARLLQSMGGQRLVVHVGSPKGSDREAAIALCAKRLVEAGLADIRLCLETMGRPSVLGTMEEILRLVSIDDSFLPCVDFAHLHAINGGALNSNVDFAVVLDRLEAALGQDRARQAHMHFSRIEFGGKGEIRHRTFADAGFGPDFSLLAPLLVSRGYEGTLICESRGTMAEDAAQMLRMADTVLPD